MSPSNVVFCIALSVLAINAASLNEPQETTLQTAKEKCIDSINQTFDRVRQTYKDTESLGNPEADRLALHHGLEFITNLIKTVNETKSMDDVEESKVFSDIPVFCNNKVLTQLTELTVQMLAVDEYKR